MTDLGRDPHDGWLEQELREAAPQARALFVDELARRVRVQRFRMRPSRARMGLALGFSALMIAALGVLGAPGLVAHAATAIAKTAKTAVSGGGTTSTTTVVGGTSGSKQYERPVPICHRGGDVFNPTWTLVIDVPSAHDGHPDIIPAPPWGCPPHHNRGGPPSETTTTIIQTASPLGASPDQKSFFVSVSGGSPQGTIECYDGLRRFATISVPLGAARCVAQGLTSGTHAITAIFKTGDVNKWASSAANVLSVKVTKASDVRVATSQAAAPFGAAVTFTALLSAPEGAAPPTGTVQFFDGSAPLGGPTALTAAGTAVLSTSALAVGSHTIRVVYGGDALYGPSSATAAVTIDAPPAPTPTPTQPHPQPHPQPQAEQEPTTTATTTPPLPQRQPTPEVPQAPPASLTTTVKPATAGTVSVAPSSGTTAPTTVAWASTTFGATPARVTATVQPPATTAGVQFASGSAVIQIDAVTDSGQAITALNDALDIAIPNAPTDVAPMYQRGSDPWVLIPRLGGANLPAGQPDGWYVHGATLHILTRHLTRFGLAKALEVSWGTRRRVHLRWAQRIVVYGAPSVDANATYTLRRGKTVYGRWTRTLPAGKGAPANLWLAGKRVKPGTYRLTIEIKAGPQHWAQVVLIRYL